MFYGDEFTQEEFIALKNNSAAKDAFKKKTSSAF